MLLISSPAAKKSKHYSSISDSFTLSNASIDRGTESG